ncbi:MAG: carbohydrate porin [Deltaproteobacteria bacterium]|nr:carbohydrate porin [Deltaproteobacteria bacterium]
MARSLSALSVGLLLVVAGPAQAQSDSVPVLDPDGATLFSHPDTWWWSSGQVNLITQAHPTFTSPYSGPNSLSASAEARTSYVATLYLGARVTHLTELLFDVESAGGRGIGDALGLGGFTDLDVVRNPTLGPAPYIARAMVRQIISFSSDEVEEHRDNLHLAGKVPKRRLELRAGKFGTADFFDTNSYGSDSHLQFMNWTVDNNGSYDYAADTRGYTLGAILDYEEPRFGVLFGAMLMPTIANGPDYDFDIQHAHAENLEVDIRESIAERAGVVRLIGYANHADMGSYREAITAYQLGVDPVPNVDAHREKGRIKYGFSGNLEQTLQGPLACFARAGWNEGHNESFAYTEVDDTVELGLHLDGSLYGRSLDSSGLSAVTNGLSPDHREYLALGGSGFILGDGRLTYARETIVEGYYTASLTHGVFAAIDAQFVANPGFNRDRGPLWVGSLRLHFEI